MSRAFRLVDVVDGSAYVEALDGRPLGRVDRLDHGERVRGALWKAVPNPLPNPREERSLPDLFPTRTAAAQALAAHQAEEGTNP